MFMTMIDMPIEMILELNIAYPNLTTDYDEHYDSTTLVGTYQDVHDAMLFVGAEEEDTNNIMCMSAN